MKRHPYSEDRLKKLRRLLSELLKKFKPESQEPPEEAHVGARLPRGPKPRSGQAAEPLP
jgi:hypothetical protein